MLIVDVPSLCSSWQEFRPRQGDRLTDESAEVLLENNEARKVWGCESDATDG